MLTTVGTAHRGFHRAPRFRLLSLHSGALQLEPDEPVDATTSRCEAEPALIVTEPRSTLLVGSPLKPRWMSRADRGVRPVLSLRLLPGAPNEIEGLPVRPTLRFPPDA